MTLFLANDQILESVDPTTGAETYANAFTYGANVVDNGGDYQGAYVYDTGEMVSLGGMVRNTVALAAGAVILKVHSLLSPNANEMVSIEVNGTKLSAEIDVNGSLTTKAAIGVNGTISLNEVKFLNKAIFATVVEDPALDTYYPITQSGKGSIEPVANTITKMWVPFAQEFETIPYVVATPNTSAPEVYLKEFTVSNITTKGFMAYIYRTETTETTFNWIATVEGDNGTYNPVGNPQS